MEKHLDSILSEATASKSLPCVGAVILDASGNTLYKHVSGSTNVDDPEAAPFTADTQMQIHSMTKVVTSTAVLQLLEQGKIALNDPVEKYCPEAANLEVLEGFDDEGTPIVRAPKNKMTVLHLLTHTSGLSYDFWYEPTFRWASWKGRSIGALITREAFNQALLFDPGTQHRYGVNNDWIGFIIEAVTGQRLEDYVREHITDPLGLQNTGPWWDTDKSFASMHMRDPASGNIFAVPQIKFGPGQEVYGGGHYLHSSLNDYAQILLTLLNNGTHPHLKVQLLEPETVEKYLFTDALTTLLDPPLDLAEAKVGELPKTTAPGLGNEGHVPPDVPANEKGWSCASLAINLKDSTVTIKPSKRQEAVKATAITKPGRSKGSAAWAGLPNCYYWLDREAGRTGLIVTQLFPFMDEEALRVLAELEGSTYEEIERNKI